MHVLLAFSELMFSFRMAARWYLQDVLSVKSDGSIKNHCTSILAIQRPKINPFLEPRLWQNGECQEAEDRTMIKVNLLCPLASNVVSVDQT